MNKRFTEINDFMESVRALTYKASALSITQETIEHICAIDPEFTQDVERLVSLFATSSPSPFVMEDDNDEDTTTATTVTTTTPTTTITATTVTDTTISESEETESLEKTDKPEEVVDDNWKTHPTMKDYRFSPDGKVQRKSEKGWINIRTRIHCGYIRFGQHQLAREMLNTFVCIGSRSMTPLYKDGNKYNCHIDNLEWTTARSTQKDPSEIEKACKIISENPNMEKWELSI